MRVILALLYLTCAQAFTLVWVTVTYSGALTVYKSAFTLSPTSMWSTIASPLTGTVGLGSLKGTVGEARTHVASVVNEAASLSTNTVSMSVAAVAFSQAPANQGGSAYSTSKVTYDTALLKKTTTTTTGTAATGTGTGTGTGTTTGAATGVATGTTSTSSTTTPAAAAAVAATTSKSSTTTGAAAAAAAVAATTSSKTTSTAAAV